MRAVVICAVRMKELAARASRGLRGQTWDGESMTIRSLIKPDTMTPGSMSVRSDARQTVDPLAVSDGVVKHTQEKGTPAGKCPIVSHVT
jgi:hypothetical protein